ncbi:MAG: fused MFS/spermidine synthase [Candidatus Omnitrophota bacterium]|nr:fused MFS/spermidine synthase [Candidatus Omnitrophota bacterium]
MCPLFIDGSVMRKIFLLNSITFLSAFLLFQIELIVSKILLPDFGGSYFVWGACVVFFQAILFLGYFYSYAILRKIGIERYRKFYLGLFLLPLLCFPGSGFPEINSVNLSIPLVANVFWYLLWTIGAVFFVLSTTSVILQSWLADSDLAEKNNPYALFALSNLGSFAALVTYPFLFEIFLDLDQQLLLWRVMYFLLLGLIVLAVSTIKVNSENRVTKIWSMNGILRQDCFKWLLFSAAGVIMFLSVTNMFTYEIAPIPLLWVVPLCIYLASFVLNFKRKSWSPAWVVDKFYLTFAWSVVLFFITLMRILPLIMELVITCWFLFHTCMFCQYQLNKTKPANLGNLPLFYLIVSLGGFIGGIFTTWVMPLISVSISEYLLGLAVIALALAIGTKYQRLGWRNIFLVAYVCIMLMAWPLFFKRYSLFGIIIIFLVFKICYSHLIKNPRAFLLSILLALLITPLMYSFWTKNNYLYKHRNYYGVYKVYGGNGKIMLIHGTTIHGAQFKDKERENQPLTYYHKLTPVGRLLSRPNVGKNIGVIGLGTGGLAAYARDDQEIDYFEIDPDMYFIAQNLFTYIKHSRGKINFIFGDARIKIKEAKAARYDILVVDAFSGDAIPVHLLTTEAINEYRKHLTEEGIILFHISNRYLNFIPVLFSNANYLNAYACYKSNRAISRDDIFATTWFALSWDSGSFSKLVTEFKWSQYVPGKNRLIRPWTDKYSDMLLIMDLNNFLDPLKYFQPFYW